MGSLLHGMWAFKMQFLSVIQKERWYVYNIFTTNHGWLVIIGSNLNLELRLLF